jgi:hypothetical protein
VGGGGLDWTIKITFVKTIWLYLFGILAPNQPDAEEHLLLLILSLGSPVLSAKV